jgi:hypothetical protein
MKVRGRCSDIGDDGREVLGVFFVLSDLSDVCKDGKGYWGGGPRFCGCRR